MSNMQPNPKSVKLISSKGKFSRKDFALVKMGETIEDMCKENDIQEKTIIFSIDGEKMWHEKIMKQMKKENLTEILFKTDRKKNRKSHQET